MKIKQVYISDENFERLIGINASALVNELLNGHFDKQDTKKLSPEERAREIALLEVKVESAKKIEAIQNGN